MEIVIAIKSEDTENLRAENGNLAPKSKNLEMCEVSEEERKIKEPEGEKSDCVIEVKHLNESLSHDRSSRGEKICRICHLGNSENPSQESLDLIQLGCGCKDELGLSHLHCAETWFKQKGNGQCEICGQRATNIAVKEEDKFAVEWNEMRLMTATIAAYSEREDSALCKRRFCNILLACLVLGFILPWFFRIALR